jgi:prepilin-type N-terminal cleavage/methylation domain-containing protein
MTAVASGREAGGDRRAGRPGPARPPARRPRGGRGAAGLTLVELVVVLAILAVATLLVLPAVGRGAETLRLRSEAGRVAALLREARQRAVSQRRPARVRLEAAGTTVILASGDPDRPARRLALARGVRISADGDQDVLTFSPRGTARPARWVVESASGRRLAVEVEALTGRVTVGREGRS